MNASASNLLGASGIARCGLCGTRGQPPAAGEPMVSGNATIVFEPLA